MKVSVKNPLERLQRSAVVTLCVLILAGSLSSCTSKSDGDDEIVTDPDAAILGKWELVLIQNKTLDTKKSHTPKGYTEYLPDGRLAWYDNATKVYTLFEEKYWVDNSYGWRNPPSEFLVEDGWVLHYETTWKEVVYATGEVKTQLVGPDFPDKPHGNQFHLTFINRNTMCLYSLDLSPIAGHVDGIYKRKN